MELFPLIAGVLSVSAVFSWINHRWVRLPTTIGVMVIALALSLVLMGLDAVGVRVAAPAARLLEELHFKETLMVLTWGGLRGGISVALALSIPEEVAGRGLIVGITYAVVLFSIVVQGLTVGRLLRRIPRAT